MGAVYRGYDPTSGREVAIKVLLKGREATHAQRTRFGREAKALAKVDHPNVVRLLDSGEDKGVPFLVMEYHASGSLGEALKTKSFSPLSVAELGAGLAAGLEAAHDLGVLHRDLKPDNVLLSAEGVAKLTDFGLAKDLQREGQTQGLTHSGVFLGTPGYWAPEQAAGHAGSAGPAIDVYGLGATLYAALTGRPPIVGEGLIAILDATANETPPLIRSLNPEVSKELESVVMRCLKKDPQARYATAGELRQVLEACAQPSQERALSSSRRRRLAIGGAAVGVGVLVTLGTLGLPRAEVPSSKPQSSPEETSQPSPEETSPDAIALFEHAQARRGLERAHLPLELVRRAAALGHPPAMTELGVMYDEGPRPAQDLAKAAMWFRRAAEKGDERGMFNLGVALLEARGLTQDPPQAAMWFRRAAGSGYEKAMLNLGIMLSEDRGIAEDLPQAAAWFRRAAELGHPKAMVALGRMLHAGRGLRQDSDRAAKWFRTAAERGNTSAMFCLAVSYAKGWGVPADPAMSVAWYQLAAAGGHLEAMLDLGISYYVGRGVSKDLSLALKWFERAAEGGNARAMFNLGVMHTEGQGVAQDLSLAVVWYRRSAEKGHPPAMYSLGRALRDGRGVAKDVARAEHWIRRAAESDDPKTSRNARALLGPRGD